MLQRRLIALCTGLLFFLATHAQVNLQTGSATFSLPMFDWKDDKSRLSTVVALSYNSGSGLKVSDVASNVGQGWNLQAGGVISRMPLGEPDDQKGYGQETDVDLTKYPDGLLYSFANNSPDKGCPTALTRYPIYRSKNQKYKQHNGVTVDKQLDYFSFQFNGKSGMFVVNPGLDGGCKPLGTTKMKITFQKDENLLNQGIRTTITSFTIQDEDGMIYRFRQHGLTQVLESKYCDKYMSQTQDQPNFKSRGVYYQSGFPNPQYVRPWIIENWYLDEIEDPLTHRKIIFHYDIEEVLDILGGAEVSYDSWHNYVIVTYKKSIEKVKVLTSVDCPDGHKVIFNYNKARVDLPNDKALTSVDVTYTAPNKINFPETRTLSRHVLNTTYFILNRYGNPSTAMEKIMARLCLRSVKKIGPDLKEDAQPYSFDYYMGSNTSDDFVPSRFCVSHDIWGYYNGDQTTGYNGEAISPLSGYGDLDFQRLRGLCYLRDGVSGSVLNAKQNYAKNGLLKQIIYPTGGALSYDYAQNKGIFIGSSTTEMIGGVHVSITKSTDGGYSNDCAHPLTTQYHYVLDGSGAPGDPNRPSSLWGIERPDNVGEMTMNYAPEKRNYRWNPIKCKGGIFGCCYWAYQYPGIQSQPQALALTGFQKFMVSAEPVLGALSAVMTVVDIIIVATSTAGGPPGAIIALVIDIISSYVILALSCTSDNSKHGTSVSYYSFDMNGASPLPMQFKRVETVEGSGDIGRTVYEFTNNVDHEIWQYNNPNLSGKQRFAPWAYGLPKKVTVYDKSNKKVKETENQYSYDFAKIPLVTLKTIFSNTIPPLPIPTVTPLTSCKCNVKTISSQRSDDWIKPENINATQTTSDNAMGVEIYPLYTGRTLLIGSKDRVYKKGDDAQWVETVTNYYYDSEFEQLQSVSRRGSEGTYITKGTIFSKSFSGGIIDVMKQNNMLNIPIKSVEYTEGGNNGYFHETIYEYTQTANGDIKLYRTLQQRSDRPTNNWTHYAGPVSTDYSKYKVTKLLSYDANGNLISVKDEGGRSVATIYDYNDKYIVASVANADAAADKPAYTSFETAATGGWQLAASASFDPNAVTGKWSLNLAGNSCTAPINNTSKAYILSFWANNSNVSLTAGATLVKSAPLVNGFTYYEYNIVAGTTSVTVSGNALIDELRLYPATAIMTTTTYDPLIGKTSECDENNRVTYFEYDDMARLRFIKDENRNIVKMYEYNNVARPNGCPATYYNLQITQYFTKSNCGPDYIGSDFSYTIPANKYSSSISQEDADAQAEMELMDKGQANADAQPNNSSNCKLVYYNAGRSENFVTESCVDGYEGGTVTYTVPARRYSSIIPGEADQMEADDIAANGQAYANDPAHRICTLDVNPVWELVEGRTECRTVNSEGHLFAEYKDINPNSPSFNMFEWKDTGPNSTCPSGPWYSADVSGDYRSTCPSGWYGYNVYISMPAGAFVSYVSQEDANNKATAEAQRRADQRYYCEGPPVYVEGTISVWWPDNPWIEVFFQNAYTGEVYSFAGYQGYTMSGGIPEGAYDVFFSVTGPRSDYYDLYMCGFVAHGTWNFISRNQMYVSENGCNTFSVYPHQNH